jgi:hypothetical protein
MAISILMGDLNLIGDYNAARRMFAASAGCTKCLQVIHLHIVHYPFLTLAECRVGADRMSGRSTPTIPAKGLASAATDRLKPTREFVCLLGAAERRTK